MVNIKLNSDKSVDVRNSYSNRVLRVINQIHKLEQEKSPAFGSKNSDRAKFPGWGPTFCMFAGSR